MTDEEATLLAAYERVNTSDLMGALRHLEQHPVADAPDLVSTAERFRGCLLVRLEQFEAGFDLLDRNRLSGVLPRRLVLDYGFTVEPTELARACRGLFDCLATSMMPSGLVSAVTGAPLLDYAQASTLSHVRALEKRLAGLGSLRVSRRGDRRRERRHEPGEMRGSIRTSMS
jgi:hypothetical protein